jgi:hypothetical protein
MSESPAVCHVLVEHRGGANRLTPDGILAFSKCRNEALRLPAFLRHYRRLGVAQFFIVDHDSSDGTTELLSSQSDVRLFRTTGRFSEARGGTAWLNALLAEFGIGHWCVTVDIDELLCYPGSEHSDLHALTRYLDGDRREAMACLLLDLYPEGPLSEVEYAPGQDLLSVAPLFDSGPYKRIEAIACPGFFATGGVRERVFYPELRASSLQARLGGWMRGVVRRLPLLRRTTASRAVRPRLAPCLTKVPLVKWEAGTRYLDVNHFVSSRRVARESGALLHFKFLRDFPAQAVRESQRAEYFDGAAEYKRYAAKTAADPALLLRYEGSVRFTNTRQLVEMQLMADTSEWTRARTADANQPTSDARE